MSELTPSFRQPSMRPVVKGSIRTSENSTWFDTNGISRFRYRQRWSYATLRSTDLAHVCVYILDLLQTQVTRFNSLDFAGRIRLRKRFT